MYVDLAKCTLTLRGAAHGILLDIGYSLYDTGYIRLLNYCNSPVQALSINAPAPSLGLVLYSSGYVIHYPTPPHTNC